MRFAPTDHTVYQHVCKVQSGFKMPDYPAQESVQSLYALDGSLIGQVQFGARLKTRTEFTLIGMTATAYHAVHDYLQANFGKRVRVEMQSAGERVFGVAIPAEAVARYCFVTGITPNAETGFSADRKLFSLTIELELAGALSTSTPNAADTSYLDILIDADFIRVKVRVATAADLAGYTPVGGDKAYVQDQHKVYVYNTDPARGVGPGWDFFQDVPPDDETLGLKDGVFRVSAFADVSASAPGMDAAYKADILMEDSVKLPIYSVSDAKDGPAIEQRQGFGFSFRVDSGLQHYAAAHSFSFYNAECRIYFYDRTNGIKQLKRTGINARNSFSYTEYPFEVEPSINSATQGFPDVLATKDAYPLAADKWRGKPVYATFGRHQKALLQPLDFGMRPIRFSDGRRYAQFDEYFGVDLIVNLQLPTGLMETALGLTDLTTYAPSERTLWVQIADQADEQPDLQKLKRVLSIVNADTNLVQFVLSEGWEVPPNSTSLFSFSYSEIDLVIDSQKCVGSRAPGYLVPESAEGSLQPLDLFGKGPRDDYVKIPSGVFRVLGDKENRLTVDTDSIYLDTAEKIAVRESVEGKAVRDIPAAIIGHTTGSPPRREYDFGWTPEGIVSAEVAFTPIAKIDNWENKYALQATGKDGQQVQVKTASGQGRVYAAYAQSSVALCWTPWPGALYEVSRWKIVPVRTGNRTRLEPQLDQVLDGAWDGTTYVDTSVTPDVNQQYEYRIVPVVAGQVHTAVASNRGVCFNTKVGDIALQVAVGDGSVSICWVLQQNQSRVAIEINASGAFEPIAGSPLNSSTDCTYVVPALANGTTYKIRIKVTAGSYAAFGTTWAAAQNTQQAFMLRPAAYSAARDPYQGMEIYDLQDVFVRRAGCRNWLEDDGQGILATGLVNTWLVRAPVIDLPSAVKEARVLTDFVIQCAVSYKNNTEPVPFSIQMRGLTEDGKTVFVVQHEDLTTAITTYGIFDGAYARFQNLPESMGGQAQDSYYNQDSSSANEDGLYTGKDLWKLPTFLFEDGAFEWAKVKYLMFALTNADPIPGNKVRHGGLGFRIYYGAYSGDAPLMYQAHKGRYFIEVNKEFSGGLNQPIIIRVDGGRVDDVDGTDTGIAGRIIEKPTHLIRHVVRKMTGQQPLFGFGEFDGRDRWLWHWQPTEQKSTMDVLQLLAKNAWGIWTFTEDDRLLLRRLDIDPSESNIVYTFDESNIVELGDVEQRRRQDIYQRFRFPYNWDVETETWKDEMYLSFNEETGKPEVTGYRDLVDDGKGQPLETGSLDGLEELLKASMRLFARGGQPNEYGTADRAQPFEFFYRPTQAIEGGDIELALPNARTLWGPTIQTPKQAMREAAKKVIKHFYANAWFFEVTADVRLWIYHPDVSGLKPDGSVDHRIKIGDVVRIKGSHATRSEFVLCLVLDIDPKEFKKGKATFHLFAPEPPNVLGPLIDAEWDAGEVGRRNSFRMVFKDGHLGLEEEEGTYADAGGEGPRDVDDFTFPDGSFADAMGLGAGRN